MATIDINQLKQLREEIGAGVSDCRAALEESGGDMEKAKEILRKKGIERAEKKAEREIKAGLIYAYIHNGRVGAMVEVGCETDFVAKTEDFVNLCKEVAMQVASMNPENVEELLNQAYIRDLKLTIGDLVKGVIGKLGENIQVRRIIRFSLSG